MRAEEFLASQWGTFLVTGTSEKTIKFEGFYVMEDAVLADLEDEADTDVRTDYLTSATDTIKAGTIVRKTADIDYFSAITLTSGSVMLILSKQ